MTITIIKPRSDNFDKRQQEINKKLEVLFARPVETTDKFAERRVRHEKTRRDRASGAQKRNFDNKQLRAAWTQDIRASAASFPFQTCNGKRSRALPARKAELAQARASQKGKKVG